LERGPRREKRRAEKQFVADDRLEFLLFISHQHHTQTLSPHMKDEFDLFEGSFISSFLVGPIAPLFFPSALVANLFVARRVNAFLAATALVRRFIICRRSLSWLWPFFSH